MIVLLPSSVAHLIAAYGQTWGYLDLRQDINDGVLVIAGASKRDALKIPPTSGWLRSHYTSGSPRGDNAGFWNTAESDLATDGFHRMTRHGCLDTETEFKPRLRSWQRLPGGGPFYVLTHDDTGQWGGWYVEGSSTTFIPVTVVEEEAALLAPLAASWPLKRLAETHLLLVGAGSIGGAAAEALASYGIHRITIVDPEHLVPHNFARHRLHPRVVGRNKANALRDQLLDRDRDLDVRAFPLNVIDNADLVRDLVTEASLVLVTSDGVASRRVMNHIASWAEKDAVYACVLEDGAIGEVLRVRPGITGCLECDRETMVEAGTLDPEEGLERGYLEGGGARPMTAVGGDLHLVGQLAAKIVVASALERGGDRAQTLPGDVMTIGLRPIPDLVAPFDLERTLEVRWRSLPASRAECPSCGVR